jgi:hypothetical protein
VTSGDALRLIQHRELLVDLERALELIGYGLTREAGTDVPESPAPSEDMVARVRLRALVSRAQHDSTASPRHGQPHGTGGDPSVNWHWPTTDEDRPQDWRTGLWAGASIPWVAAASPPNRSMRPPLVPEQSAPPVVDMTSIDRREPVELEPEDLLSADLPQSLFGDMLRRRTETKKIDADAVVAKLARLEPLRTIPRVRGVRSARTLQIVHDIGLLNGPLGADLRDLCDRIAAEVPRPFRQLVAFRHRLSDGCGTGPVWTWRSYRPPSSTSTVVVFVSGRSARDPVGRQAELEARMRSLQRRGFHTAGVWLGPLPMARSDRSTWLVVDA